MSQSNIKLVSSKDIFTVHMVLLKLEFAALKVVEESLNQVANTFLFSRALFFYENVFIRSSRLRLTDIYKCKNIIRTLPSLRVS